MLSPIFECPFSQSRWNTIPINWNLNSQPLDMVIEAREAFGSIIFREIFITACWIVWLIRNSVIFYNGQINLITWNTRFKEELGYVCAKAKASGQSLLNSWRDSYK